MKIEAIVDGGSGKSIEIERLDDRRFRIDGREREVSVEVIESGIYSLVVDGHSYEVTVREDKKGLLVEIGPHLIPVRLVDSFKRKGEVNSSAPGEAVIVSPMPGRIIGIKVSGGQEVKEGEGIIVVEARKMENDLHAHKSGKVKKVMVKVGDAVEGGQDLIVIE